VVRVPEPGEVKVQLHVVVPAWLKEEVVGALNGVSLNQWVLNALWNELRFGGCPRPVPSCAPSVVDVVGAYVSGERLLGPCGERWPCGVDGVGGRVFVGSRVFCGVCGVGVG
jgi:hypothetical protein